MRRFRLTAIVAVALAGGCSLVNSIDDVKPADDGTFSTTITGGGSNP